MRYCRFLGQMISRYTECGRSFVTNLNLFIDDISVFCLKAKDGYRLYVRGYKPVRCRGFFADIDKKYLVATVSSLDKLFFEFHNICCEVLAHTTVVSDVTGDFMRIIYE